MALTRDDINLLAKPFRRAEHEFTRGYVYISEEAIAARLDEVDPSWSFELADVRVRDKQGVAVGRLTVNGVTRSNVGMQAIEYVKDKQTKEVTDTESGEPEKGAATDALKRCARLFGIGRYLLDSPPRVSEVNGRTEDAKFNEWLKAKQKAWAEANTPKTEPTPVSVPTSEPQEAPAPNVTPFPPQTNASAEFDAAFPPANGKPAPHWTAEKTAQDKFFGWANKTYALGVAAVLEALGVQTITQYAGTKEDALKAIKAWIDVKQEAG